MEVVEPFAEDQVINSNGSAPAVVKVNVGARGLRVKVLLGIHYIAHLKNHSDQLVLVSLFKPHRLISFAAYHHDDFLFKLGVRDGF